MAYTTRAAIERVLSLEGAVLHADDDQDWVGEPGVYEDVAEEASEDIDLYCRERYDEAALASSGWIQRKAAVLGAYYLCCRRGNPPPDSLQRRYDKIFEELALIQKGQLDVPGLAEAHSTAPCLSNVRLDGRFRQSKIRVQPSISTGTPPQHLTQKVDWTDQGYDPAR